ncbi:MAG: ribulose-phosphate 3-epimerase [Proteobacteria bacterium]|nr:ribulose-phosphate 3-epimerase [Pseudomonadota bacterium]
MKLIAPSILSADFTKLGEDMTAVEKAGSDWIHIDVMDGHFVPNISYGPIIVKACKKITSLPLDVHLMIDAPDRYIPEFANAGADYISVHVEACPHLHRTIQLIKSTGKKAGVAVNPATSLSTVDWILEELDYILLMSVNPGFGGQSFIASSLDKVRQLSAQINEKKLRTLIQIDGGVCLENIGEISDAGTDVFVAGSSIFGSNDYAKTIAAFRGRIIK